MLEHEALAFSFNVEGKIWKIAFDSTEMNLAFELRNEETLQVHFLVFKLSTLDTTEYLHYREADWWVSLLEINNNYLIIDKYLDPQNPVEKALIIADWRIDTVVKTIPDFQLAEIEQDELIGQSIKNRGENLKEKLQGLRHVKEGNIQYPGVFEENDEHFNLVQSYLGKEICLAVEYFENDSAIVMSYYTLIEDKYERSLLVVKNDAEIYHEVIDDKMDGRALGSFFVVQNQVFFIINQTQFNGIDI